MPPFKSKSQMKYLFANKPELAKEWASKYGAPKDLPEKKEKKSKKKGKFSKLSKHLK
jgi:hypothetical protein